MYNSMFGNDEDEGITMDEIFPGRYDQTPSAHIEVGGAYSFQGGTREALANGSMGYQTMQGQWVRQPAGNAFNKFSAGPDDQTLSAHPEVGGAYSFQGGTREALGFGSMGDQTMQGQWVRQPAVGGAYSFQGGTREALGCGSMNDQTLKDQCLRQPEAAVIMENPSQPSLEIVKNQAGDKKYCDKKKITEPSLKILKRREYCKKYRHKKKDERIALETERETLAERCKNLENSIAEKDKVILAQSKELIYYKERQFRAMKKKIDAQKRRVKEQTAQTDKLSEAIISQEQVPSSIMLTQNGASHGPI